MLKLCDMKYDQVWFVELSDMWAGIVPTYTNQNLTPYLAKFDSVTSFIFSDFYKFTAITSKPP